MVQRAVARGLVREMKFFINTILGETVVMKTEI